jgi:hypothetical protein
MSQIPSPSADGSNATSTVPEDFAESLLDKVLALRDVLQASDLLQELMDPMLLPNQPATLPDVSRAGLASLLRIVNRDLAVWLRGLEELLSVAGVALPPHAE